jgi:hypothetical protein
VAVVAAGRQASTVHIYDSGQDMEIIGGSGTGAARSRFRSGVEIIGHAAVWRIRNRRRKEPIQVRHGNNWLSSSLADPEPEPQRADSGQAWQQSAQQQSGGSGTGAARSRFILLAEAEAAQLQYLLN